MHLIPSILIFRIYDQVLACSLYTRILINDDCDDDGGSGEQGGIVHKQAKWSQALSTSRVTKQWPLQLSASFRNCFIAFACLTTRGQIFAPFSLLQWKTTIARMTKKGQLCVALGESAYSSWVCSPSILGLLPLAYIRHASCELPVPHSSIAKTSKYC